VQVLVLVWAQAPSQAAAPSQSDLPDQAPDLSVQALARHLPAMARCWAKASSSVPGD
jgi:hypothetical protein